MWKACFTSGSADVELHHPLGHDLLQPSAYEVGPLWAASQLHHVGDDKPSSSLRCRSDTDRKDTPNQVYRRRYVRGRLLAGQFSLAFDYSWRILVRIIHDL